MAETQDEKMIRLRRDLRENVVESGLRLTDFSGDQEYKLATLEMRLAQLAENVRHAQNSLRGRGLSADADIDTVAGEIRTELSE